jgi:hypothetical protein
MHFHAAYLGLATAFDAKGRPEAASALMTRRQSVMTAATKTTARNAKSASPAGSADGSTMQAALVTEARVGDLERLNISTLLCLIANGH